MPKLHHYRCFRLLCVCVLGSLAFLLVRQGNSYSRRLVVLLTDNQSLQSTAHSNWKSGYGNVSNGSFPVQFPRLYDSLTPALAAPINFTAFIRNSSSSIASTATSCQRPEPQNLAHLLLAKPTLLAGSQSPLAGGLWVPANCWPPLSHTAVIVPYRNRSLNLDVFVPYMQAILQRQNILFAIFVVEQANSRLFNRAKLLNVGFLAAQKFHAFDCFVFQDADKVPENVANVFDCANSPKLLISEMRNQENGSKYIPGRLYGGFFGGTVAISREAFLKVNGNSNAYYGWGREDDELAARLSIQGYSIRYNSGALARFVNLRHSHDIVTNAMPWPYAHKVRQTMKSDGLNSLNYTDMGLYLHPMFVLIRADV